MTNELRRKIWNLIRGGNFHGYLQRSEGYPLTLTDCMAEYPISLAVSGNTVQDGTPAPDNPVEVQGVGDRTANLLSFKEWLEHIKSLTNPISNGSYTATNETFTIIGKANVDCYTMTYYTNSYRVSVKPNTTYKLTWRAVGDFGYVYAFVNSKQTTDYIFIAANTTGIMTFTTPANASYLNFRVGVTGINKTCTYSDFQLNTVDDYEPYGYKVPLVLSNSNGEQQTFPIYTDAPLYGNGTISDTVELNVENKAATLVRRYGVVSFDGSEAWNTSSLAIDNYCRLTYHGTLYIAKGDIGLSNLFERKLTSNWSAGMATEHFVVSKINGAICVSISSTRASTVDEFKTWLSEQATAGTPLTVVYQLATPVTTDISDMQDWDSIPKLWRGTAILTADTTVSPSIITAKYYADKPEEVN